MYAYDALLIDVVNLGYKTFYKESPLREKIGNKIVYKNFVADFIETLSFLEKKYFSLPGDVYLLFDNYTSREEIKQLFEPLSAKKNKNRRKINSDYKASRKKAPKEFYNSLDLIKYYYMISPPRYKIVQIPSLEADDLVKPCILFLQQQGKKRLLLVTDDSDWCRYLKKEEIFYLPSLYQNPVGYEDFFLLHNYYPSEEKIILYKLLAGDRADNVKAIFPELKPEMVLSFVKKYDSVIDFIYEEVKKGGTFARAIKEKERDLRTSYQMLSSVEVSEKQFQAYCIVGRDSKAHQNVLNQLLFPHEEKEKFNFGSVKIPRIHSEDLPLI